MHIKFNVIVIFGDVNLGKCALNTFYFTEKTIG